MDNFNLHSLKWPSFRGKMTPIVLSKSNVYPVYEQHQNFHLKKNKMYNDSWLEPTTRGKQKWKILGYYVYYKKTNKGDDEPFHLETVEPWQKPLNISNLGDWKEYDAIVRAFNKIGPSALVLSTKTTLGQDMVTHASVLGPPQVTLTSQTTDSITLSWDQKTILLLQF